MVQLSSRGQARISRREELLAIAAALFAERGFAGVTVDDIGAAAGVSGPALYHHFESKDAMLGEMLIAISEHLLNQGKQTVRLQSEPARALDQMVRDHVSFAIGHPELITVHHRDLVHTTESDHRRIRRLQAAYVELWVDLIAHASPSLNRRSATAAVLAAIGLINSTPHSARIGSEPLAALLQRMALGALHAV